MHYYSFNIGDYASHTRHLSPTEDIAYRRMLDLYYMSEKPLPEDPAEVTRLINMRDYPSDVMTVLEEFFTPVEGVGWVNTKVDAEISKYHGKRESASRAGKASVESKLNKRSTDVQRTFNTNSTDVQPTNNHKPITINQEPETKNQFSIGAAKTPPQKKGTRLPNDWHPSEDLMTWAKTEFPNTDVLIETDKFKDYWRSKAGASATKLDWDATFRNWIRSARGRPVDKLTPMEKYKALCETDRTKFNPEVTNF